MLAQIRTFAKSPIANFLLAILAVSFVVWGIRGGFGNVTPSNAVIKAGPRSIDAGRYRQMVQDYLKQVSQQTGQQVSLQDVVTQNLDREIAEGIATDEALAALLTRMGIRPSDKLVLQQIQKASMFYDPVSGRFDKAAYERFVQQTGMTDVQFENLLRDDIAQNQFVSGMVAGLRAPLIYPALQAAFAREGRTFTYFTLGPDAAGPPPHPNDAQLTAFMKENAAQLTRPEGRVLTVVRFSAAQIAPTLPVNEADVQKRFNFEKDTLNTPEKRSLVEIPIKNPAQAADAAARLKRGEDPAAVARSLGVQPVVYTNAPKSAIADRTVADAAFSAKAGDVIGPIHGDLGLAVAKVNAVTPGHTVTLAEVRPRIEAEVRKDAAQSKIYDEVQKFEDARSGGASVAEAAKKLGLQTVTLPPITAKGTTMQGQPAPLPPKLVQTAFSLPAGGESDVVDLGQGEYFALHVDKVLPPSLPSLDEIRAPLTQAYVVRETMTKLEAKADALAAKVKAGQPVPAVAASAGAQVGHAVGVLQTSAGQTFSTDLIQKIFTAKPGEVVVGSGVKLGVVVAKLDGVVPASPAEVAQQAVAARTRANMGLLQDLGIASRRAARDIIKPTIDFKRARDALGVGQGSGS